MIVGVKISRHFALNGLSAILLTLHEKNVVFFSKYVLQCSAAV